MDKQYLELVKKVIDNGELRKTRNSETYSLFGERLVFNKVINNEFPLLNTKKISIKNVFEELMWFLRGQTNSKILSDKGVKIWNANTTREFLDSRNLDYPEGEAGPIYGYQWNNFSGKGINQIDYCIDLIKNDPTSRRILFSAWNPVDLPKMALPPCHIVFQFYVRGGKYLDGQLYQRSADLMLGVPYNIASYYFLLVMVGYITNLEPGNLTLTFGDVHIYTNHMDGAHEQLDRLENKCIIPTIKVKDGISIKNIRDFELENFNISYEPMPNIIMKMIA